MCTSARGGEGKGKALISRTVFEMAPGPGVMCFQYVSSYKNGISY